jgi:hypothetical protein
LLELCNSQHPNGDRISRMVLDAWWKGLPHRRRYDVKGVYAGYSSAEPSFPDNHVKVEAARFKQWLAKTPTAKERAILDALIETTPNEFFHWARLFPDHSRFDSFGCAIGPASRMALPAIRKALLEMLADLPTHEWLPMGGLIAHLRASAPNLIADPALRR